MTTIHSSTPHTMYFQCISNYLIKMRLRYVTSLGFSIFALLLITTSRAQVLSTSAEDSMSASQSFFAKLEARIAEIDSHLCVGLDPHIKELFPNGDGESKSEQERCDAAFNFCKTIIDATGKSITLFLVSYLTFYF